MSIVRIGMAEDGKFGDGWDAIFKKKAAAKKAEPERPPAAKPAPKKPAKKK